MTKLAYITDLHIQNRRPRNRKDDYGKTLLGKVRWVCQEAKRLGCESTILCGGDVFDQSVIGLDRADDFIEVLEQEGMTIATVFGNHDLDASLSTATRSLLGHLMRRSPKTIFPVPILSGKPLEIGDFHIWGHHYKYQNFSDVLETKVFGDHIRVIISHAMTLESPAPFGEDTYGLIEDLQTNAHMILLGHYHPKQGPIVLENAYSTAVGGPGAMMRGSLAKDDLERQPSFAIIEASRDAKSYEYKMKFLPIEIARPSSEVFRIDEAMAERAKSEVLDQFRNVLDSNRIQSFDLSTLIEEIAKADNIPEDVRQEALRRIGAI